MKKLLIIFFCCIFPGVFAQQHTITGIVLDSKTLSPVKYTSIRVKRSQTQYCANSDGKFFLTWQPKDTLIFTCVGYQGKIMAASDLDLNPKVMLEPITYQLSEISVKTTGNVDFPYQLFSDLCENYRNQKTIEKSKVYYSFLSQCNGSPLEIIEGYFTGGTSSMKGISILMLKNGRIGVCPNKFYSMNTTDLLTGFPLFSSDVNSHLPQSPGNLNFRSLKKKFNVSIVKTAEENGSKKLVLELTPRKDSSKYFSATAWVNRTNMSIEKIQFRLNDRKFFYLNPLIKGDNVDSIQLSLQYVFDNSDPAKPVISQVFLDYSFLYSSGQIRDTLRIGSEAMLLFYDYENPFLPVIPAGLVENLPNDYQKISTLPYDSVLWEYCGIITQSEKQKFFIDYITQNGVLINFPGALDSVAGKNYIPWRSAGYLRDFTLTSPQGPKTKMMGKQVVYLPEEPKIICQILVNPVKIGDTIHINSKTYFDKKNTIYSGTMSYLSITYINLIFDLHELKRREMMKKWELMNKDHAAGLGEFKDLYAKELKELQDTLHVFNKETLQGTFADGLLAWYKHISSRTGVKRESMIGGLMQEWPEINPEGDVRVKSTKKDSR